MNKKAFTLVELMVALAVLAIIVVFALPYYQEYLDDARSRKTYMNLKSLKQAIELYQIDSNNNRNFSDRMRLDNYDSTSGNDVDFTMYDLQKYGYIKDQSEFVTGWGERFSLKKNFSTPDTYSLYAVFVLYHDDVAYTREVFLSEQE